MIGPRSQSLLVCALAFVLNVACGSDSEFDTSTCPDDAADAWEVKTEVVDLGFATRFDSPCRFVVFEEKPGEYIYRTWTFPNGLELAEIFPASCLDILNDLDGAADSDEFFEMYNTALDCLRDS